MGTCIFEKVYWLLGYLDVVFNTAAKKGPMLLVYHQNLMLLVNHQGPMPLVYHQGFSRTAFL